MVKELTALIHSNAAEKGFWEPILPQYIPMQKAQKIALMHSELSEALEAVRHPHKDTHCPEFDNEIIEFADCVIRILDYCGRFGLPLEEAIRAKIEFNITRPYKHGKTM